MAESNDLTCQVDNVFILKFVPDNLKWHEKDGLKTWYRKNKCEKFLSNTKQTKFFKTIQVIQNNTKFFKTEKLLILIV